MSVDVQDILSNFFTNHDKLRDFAKDLEVKCGEIERELSFFYHKLEGIHLSHNTQAHSHMKDLQDILGRRRDIKRQLLLARSFVDSTQDSMDVARKRNEKAHKTHKQVMDDIQTLKDRGKMKKHKNKS